jgi:hypothetical protein
MPKYVKALTAYPVLSDMANTKHPRNGNYLMFMNRICHQIKRFFWVGDGCILWYNQLEIDTLYGLRRENGDVISGLIFDTTSHTTPCYSAVKKINNTDKNASSKARTSY